MTRRRKTLLVAIALLLIAGGSARYWQATAVDNGQPFTHIVRRRMKCLDCGQFREDRACENRPGR